MKPLLYFLWYWRWPCDHDWKRNEILKPDGQHIWSWRDIVEYRCSKCGDIRLESTKR